MLNYNSLKLKGKLYYVDDDGNSEEFIDLLTKTSTNSEWASNNEELIVVNEYYIARPDLISLAVYGTDEYADIICKYNGISNPFELNEDDILRIPKLETVKELFYLDDTKSDLISESNTITRPPKYPLQKAIDDPNRTPNQSVIGEENYVINKSIGMVIY